MSEFITSKMQYKCNENLGKIKQKENWKNLYLII